MGNKRNINLSNMLENITETNIFDTFLNEIDVEEIPPRYVQKVIVYFDNGKIVELYNNDITMPISLRKNASWRDMTESHNHISDIKVYIDTLRLEKDVNRVVKHFLGNYMK